MKLTAAVLALVGLVHCGAPGPARDPSPPRELDEPSPKDTELDADLERVVKASRARLGVAFTVLETGQSHSLRGDEPFPMASVYKFPIALLVMAKVDRGEIALEAPVHVRSEELSPGWSPLAKDFPPEGKTLRVRELIEAAVAISDNTASDALLKLVGGPRSVDTFLKRLGHTQIRVDQSEIEIALDVFRSLRGRPPLPTRAAMEAFEATLTEREWIAAAHTFARSERNTTTPNAMRELLVRFWSGRVLGTASTRHLARVLENAKPDRMRLGFPAGSRVLHKTGTAWGSFNDVGIVTLPDGRHVVVAILLKDAAGLSMDDGGALVKNVAALIHAKLGPR